MGDEFEGVAEIAERRCYGCVFWSADKREECNKPAGTASTLKPPPRQIDSCTQNGNVVFIKASPNGRAEYTRLKAAYKLGLISEEESIDGKV